MIKEISNSELQSWKDCRRKWYLTYYRKLKPRNEKRVSAASLGTMVHECIEAYYVSGLDPVAYLDNVVIPASEEFITDFDRDAFTKQGDLVRIMLEGFIDWSSEEGLDQGYTVQGIEEKISAPFPMVPEGPSAGWTEVRLIGKLDLILKRNADGATINRDWKTVATIEDGGLKTLEQFQFYALILKLQGRILNGAQRVMLRKVKRTARATPPFYFADTTTFTPTILDTHMKRKSGEINDIARAEAALNSGEEAGTVSYPHWTKDCSWKCPFVGVCSSADDGSDFEGMLRDFFIEGDPHEHYSSSTTKDE